MTLRRRPPHLAEIVLRREKFDLLVISSVSDPELHRMMGICEGADVLVLDGFTMPSELLALVAQRFNRQRRSGDRDG